MGYEYDKENDNIKEEHEKEKQTIIDVTVTCSDVLFRNSIKRDKLLCFDLLEHYGVPNKLEGFTLKECLKKSKKYKATLLILYPKEKLEVDIKKFDNEECLSVYDKQIDNIFFEFWVSD